MKRKNVRWEDILEETAKAFTEKHIVGQKLTWKEFRSYCKSVERHERKQEIEAAVALLEDNGYAVMECVDHPDRRNRTQ